MKKAGAKTILTVGEVAEVLCISVSQVRRLIKSAGLPCIQFTKRGQLHFGREEVTTWWKKHAKEVK